MAVPLGTGVRIVPGDGPYHDRILITFEGTERTAREWAQHTGLLVRLIVHRVRHSGMSAADCLAPLRRYRRSVDDTEFMESRDELLAAWNARSRTDD